VSIFIKDLDFILTMNEKRDLYRRGSIQIKEDRIEKIISSEDSTEEFLQNVHADMVIDGGGMLALPGFVDTHIHVIEQITKGIIPDTLNTQDWVMNWCLPLYAEQTEEEEYMSALLACIEMIKTGTTCFLDPGAKHVSSVVKAIQESGIRGATGRLVMDLKPSALPKHWKNDWIDRLYFSTTGEALEATEEAIDNWNGASEGRVGIWATPIGLTTCSDEYYLGAKRIVDRYKTGMTFHCSSFQEEINHFRATRGSTPVQHFKKTGLLDKNILLVHMIIIDESEIEILRTRETKICQCLGSGLRLAKGLTSLSRFPEMLSKGLTLSLGCDGVCASGSADMMRQIYLASTLYKDMTKNPSFISPFEAIQMGSLHGAKALLLDRCTGSLEEGKKADIILLDIKNYEWVPTNDPYLGLVYSSTSSCVDTVIIDGKVIMEKREIKTLNEQSILEGAQKTSLALRQRTGLIP
jgi:cytosine/adenosine deaminase-related metal-dependent hydrolase